MHTEDYKLIASNVITLADLITVRKGEYTYHPLSEDPQPAVQEFVKIRGKGSGWCCIFFDNEQSICTIYQHRPIACRLLKCWDPEDVLAVTGKNLLNRRALIQGNDPLADLVCIHEDECPVSVINSLVIQLRTPGMKNKVLAELTRLVNIDLQLREYAVRAYRLSLASELFYFGRPLFQQLVPFGISVFETPDGITIQYENI